MNNVHSTLSSDGVLTIKAPPPPAALKGANERPVAITHTNMPAHLSVKNGGDHAGKTCPVSGKSSPAVQGK